jgi:cell fate (sporulation/competence/biofilm development) regulator YlbF (YheA/YmcA/DUF963 family)
MAVRWTWTWLLFGVAAGGCARQHVCPDATWSGPAENQAAAAMYVSQRPATAAEPLVIDASAVDRPRLQAMLPPRLSARTYHAIDVDEVRCRAAERSPPALLLLEEQGALSAAADCDPRGSCCAALDQEILRLRADEERNRSAASAVRAFYRLAEAEHGLQAIERSLALLDAALMDVQRGRAEGLTVQTDASTLERQRLELLDQQVTAELAVLQLNQQILQQIGAANETAVRLWPAVDLQVVAELPEEERLVAQGSARRADLQLLRRLRDDMSADSVAAARRALAMSQMGLGTVSPAGLLAQRRLCACLECEAPIRQRQVELLLYERERQAESEMRSGIYTLEARLRQIALASERLASWRRRYQELQALRAIGSATPAEISLAELETIRAETALVQQVIAWRLAQVDLEQALGRMADGCGLPAAR